MKKVLFSSQTQHWATPRELYAELDREFHFTFDPCPLGNVEAPLFGEGGLSKTWNHERIYCNPPYGPGIRPFLEKACEADLAVFLLPARTDTRWFHEIALPHAREIRFLRGRLHFNGAGSAPFPSMIVIFRNETHEQLGP